MKCPPPKQVPTRGREGKELRCTCHRLLAEHTDDTIVLKCPRCKKKAYIKVGQTSPDREIVIEFHS